MLQGVGAAIVLSLLGFSFSAASCLNNAGQVQRWHLHLSGFLRDLRYLWFPSAVFGLCFPLLIYPLVDPY